LGATATTPTGKKDTSAGKSGKASDEVEEWDVVRISSNLVPIPVSVVDVRGNAVTTLKLETLNCVSMVSLVLSAT